MPVVLDLDVADAWLAPGERDPNELLALLEPQAGGRWAAHEVDPRVGNVRNDDPTLIAPASSAEPLELPL